MLFLVFILRDLKLFICYHVFLNWQMRFSLFRSLVLFLNQNSISLLLCMKLDLRQRDNNPPPAPPFIRKEGSFCIFVQRFLVLLLEDLLLLRNR